MKMPMMSAVIITPQLESVPVPHNPIPSSTAPLVKVVVPGVTYTGRAGMYRVESVWCGPVSRVRGRRLPDGAPFSMRARDFDGIVKDWPVGDLADCVVAVRIADLAEWVDETRWAEIREETRPNPPRISGGGVAQFTDAAVATIMEEDWREYRVNRLPPLDPGFSMDELLRRAAAAVQTALRTSGPVDPAALDQATARRAVLG